MKRCHACGVEKSIDLFTKNRHRKDGTDGRCKECNRVASNNYYHSNLHKVRKKDRARREHERQLRRDSEQRRYYNNRESILEKNRIRRGKNKPNAASVDALNKAVRRGDLHRPCLCEMCGSGRSVLHGHHDSYDPDRKLVVTWMCRPCHTWTHARRNDQAVGMW